MVLGNPIVAAPAKLGALPGAATPHPAYQNKKATTASKRALALASQTSIESQTDKFRTGFSFVYANTSRSAKGYLAAGFLAAIFQGASTAVIPILMGDAMTAFYSGDEERVQEETKLIVIILAIVSVILFTTTYIRVAFSGIAGESLQRSLRTSLYASLVHETISFHSSSEGHSADHILSETVSRLGASLLQPAARMAAVLAAVAASLAVAAFASWEMTVCMLLLLPFILLEGAISVRLVSKRHTKAADTIDKATTYASETLAGISVLKSFNAEPAIKAKYGQFCEDIEKDGTRAMRADGVSVGFANVIINVIYAVTFISGAWLIIADRLTAKDLIVVMLAFISAFGSLGPAIEHLNEISKGLSAIKIFSKYSHPLKDEPSGHAKLPAAGNGIITFNNVCFSYPARPDQLVLDNFNLVIKPGTTNALVGPSGSGKSTTFGLLERFYEPTSGCIKFNNISMIDMDTEWVRSNFALVPQEPTLFSGSVADNLRISKADATDSEMWHALEQANAKEFVRALPEGLDTELGFCGDTLSGGQKQRLAIARAVLKDPRLLLLDEATSALDAHSERLVQDALERLMRTRTTLVIAHRLSTIMSADQIVVVQKGHVVESGTHDQLIALPNGLYAEMVTLQNTSQPGSMATLPKITTSGSQSSVNSSGDGSMDNELSSGSSSAEHSATDKISSQSSSNTNPRKRKRSSLRSSVSHLTVDTAGTSPVVPGLLSSRLTPRTPRSPRQPMSAPTPPGYNNGPSSAHSHSSTMSETFTGTLGRRWAARRLEASKIQAQTIIEDSAAEAAADFDSVPPP